MGEPKRSYDRRLSANARRAMDAVRSIMQRATVVDPDRVQAPKQKRDCPNARVYLTAANPQTSDVECVPTRDRSDRAHAVFAETGRAGEVLLVPGDRVDAGARPRRYPVNQMTSRGVAHDSAFDEHAEREMRLQRLGLVRVQRSLAAAQHEAERKAMNLRAIVDRNRDTFQVPSVAQEARAYLRSGAITREQYEAMVMGRRSI